MHTATRRNAEGWTPLLYAAFLGHLALVELLLLADARSVVLDGAGPDGRSPLLWACATGHEPIVAKLLAAGANASHIGADGMSALALAARHNHPVRSLIRRGFFYLRLCVYIVYGTQGVARLLLGADANIDMDTRESGTGRTPLLEAAALGHEAVFAILLDAVRKPVFVGKLVSFVAFVHSWSSMHTGCRRACTRQPRADCSAACGGGANVCLCFRVLGFFYDCTLTTRFYATQWRADPDASGHL